MIGPEPGRRALAHREPLGAGRDVGVLRDHDQPHAARRLEDVVRRRSQVDRLDDRRDDADAALASRQGELLGTHRDPDRIAYLHPVRQRERQQLPVFEAHAVALGRRGDQVRDADELGDERVHGPLVDVLCAADLLEDAVVHDGDAVGHRERLLLVVRHVHERDADLALDLLQLDLHLLAQLQVERTERLVEQQHRRQVDERARERDPLPLAARELARLGLGAVGEPHELEHLPDAARDLGLRDLLALEAEGDVVVDREVLEERVALEHRVDVAAVGRHALDRLALEQDLALVGLLEAGDHPQRRRLAAAGRPEDREERAARDVEVRGRRTATIEPKRFWMPRRLTVLCSELLIRSQGPGGTTRHVLGAARRARRAGRAAG